MAIGATGRWAEGARWSSGATIAVSSANGTACRADGPAMPGPGFAVLVAAVKVALPVLDSEPAVAAIAGVAETPAATAASAAPAVTVASRVVLLVEPTVSLRCVFTASNGGILKRESNVKPFGGRGGHALRASRLGRPMALHRAAAGGYADAPRVKAARCFGGNHHHAPGCNRLLRVNVERRGSPSREFQMAV